jgi:hypothetical protein
MLIRRIPIRQRLLFAFTRRYVIDGPVPSHQETHRAPAHPIDRLARSFRHNAPAIDRVVHHSVIAELGSEMTSYRADCRLTIMVFFPYLGTITGMMRKGKGETKTLPLPWSPAMSWS